MHLGHGDLMAKTQLPLAFVELLLGEVLYGTLEDGALGVVKTGTGTGNKFGELQDLVEALFFFLLELFDVVDYALKDSNLARLDAWN
jgi:hypothetical protein